MLNCVSLRNCIQNANKTIFVTLNLKWARPFACYDGGIYPKHERIYVAPIYLKVNQQHDHQLTPYEPKTLLS